MKAAIFTAVAAAFTLGGFVLPDFYVVTFNYIGLYTLVALGIVLLTGVVGITSFGQAAFVGVGAYTTAVLGLKFGLSPAMGLVAGMVVTLAAAALIAGVTLRLSGHYLSLSTIAWSLSVYYVFGNVEYLGGRTGLTDIAPVAIGPLLIQTSREFYGLIWVVTLLAMLLVYNMLDSRSGRAMRAIKNARETAESFGVNTIRLRFIAFLYAAAFASLSGWLYAHMLRFVNPSPFSLTKSIEYLFMAVVGGASEVWGALLGAGIIAMLKEYLQTALPALIGQPGNFETIVFGALIIVMLQLTRDRGLASLVPRLRLLNGKSGAMAESAGALEFRPRPDAIADAPVLKVDRVTKTFGGMKAVSNVGFEVRRGEIVSVIGPNGAGKSTLFNVITGTLDRDGGEILVNGHKVSDVSPRHMVRLGLARTFQHVQLVPELNVVENTMLGAHIRGHAGTIAGALGSSSGEESRLRAEAEKQLRRVGLGEVLDMPATSLALGQQRVVEIARALCADPDLLLLDEPVAGLRYREKKTLAAQLVELRQSGLSVLLVEHDMEFVMNISDRIVVVNFGEKIAEGLPEEIRRHPAVIEAYLGTGTQAA